jgi:hypothetical protein
LLIALVFALIPLSAYGTNHAGPKTPSCGNYKVSTNQVIAGVKFPKGTYQINTFGISCTKVMGSKGLFAKFLKLKDKDPLPKPWRYLADAVGAPKFSSGPGVGFRVQLITATPTPTPTPTPTRAPTPVIKKSSFFFFRFNENGQLERKGNNENSWNTADTSDSYDVSQTRANAYKAIKGNAPDFLVTKNILYTIGENVPKDMAFAYRKLVDQSFAFWGKFMFGKEIPILIFTEKDRGLLSAYWLQRWNGESTISRYEQELKYYDDLTSQKFRSVGGAAGGQEIKVGDRQGINPLVGIDFYMGSQHTQETSLLIDHVAHEFTHVLQNTLATGVAYSKISGDWSLPSTLKETDIRTPCSLFEGSAVTFGTSVPAESLRWYSDGMDLIMRRIQNSNPTIRLNTTEDVVKALLESRSWLPGKCDMGYALGALAYEFMVAEYGFDSYIKLFKSIPKTANFDDSMTAAVGLTELEFYIKAAPHILSEWKKANSQG